MTLKTPTRLFRITSLNRAVWLWGGKFELFYLSKTGQVPTKEENKSLRKLTRSGFCQAYGVVPVHLTAQILVPALYNFVASYVSGAAMSPVDTALPCFSAIAVMFMPLNRRIIRKTGGKGSAIRRRQLKVYATFLAASVAFTSGSRYLEDRKSEDMERGYGVSAGVLHHGRGVQNFPKIQLEYPLP